MGLGGYLAGKTEQEHYQSELEKDVNKILFCPGTQSMWFIVASLADSICRHPDVTLESGLVLNTFGEL